MTTRNLHIHVALEIDEEDRATDSEIALEVSAVLVAGGFAVIDTETISAADLARIHHAIQAAELALNHIRSQIKELEAYSDDIEGNLDSIGKAADEVKHGAGTG